MVGKKGDELEDGLQMMDGLSRYSEYEENERLSYQARC